MDRWVQFYGPPEEYVLRDMAEWMKSPERDLYRNFSQLGIDVAAAGVKVSNLEDRFLELESQMGSVRSLVSYNLVAAIVAFSATALLALRSRRLAGEGAAGAEESAPPS